MKKILAVSYSLLGLAVVCMPAYATPTGKKITLTCSSAAGEIVTGDATVTLCATPATCVDPTQSVVCPTINCDSSNISATIACAASFKVGAITAQIDLTDDEGNTAGSSPSATLGGKGFSTTVATDSAGPNADPDSSSDTVSLRVK